MQFLYQLVYSPFINYLIRNLNKFLRKFFPLIKIPPSGILNIRLSDHKKIKFKTNQTDFVAFSIFWDGLYQYEYVYIFEKLAKRINGFIDIGCNGGLYSLIAAKSAEEIKILSFDPTESAQYFINENIRLNQLTNRIQVFKIALSDKTEVLDFYEVKNPKYPYLKYNLGGASSLVNPPKSFRKIPVQAYAFDEFLKEYPLLDFPIDFIKIDAEGAEPSILSGMQKTIERYKPILVCEILSDAVGNEISAFFEKNGYLFYLNQGKKLTPTSKIKENKNDHTIYNYFLIHPSRLSLVQEFIS